MVDFDNEKTVGTPALDVEKISILQRRYDLIEAYELYKKANFSHAAGHLSLVRARLVSLFMELQACLKRRMASGKATEESKEAFNRIVRACFDKEVKEEEIREVFFIINEELDNIRLTRVDTQKSYDSSKVEEENKMKGY